MQRMLKHVSRKKLVFTDAWKKRKSQTPGDFRGSVLIPWRRFR